jgi:ComF family protein
MIKHQLNTTINNLFDFFLPRICPACQNKMKQDEECICSECFSKIQFATEERLISEYRRKFEGKNIISGFVSLFVFEKDKELQHVIHSVKYQKRFHNGIFLGRVMGIDLADKLKEWEINLVVPIPLHSLKKAERGYNQAYYISKGLERLTKIPLSGNAVKRVRYTQSQTTMNISERSDNMANAFKIKKRNAIAGKNILLIDDVITTGATTSECGRVLLAAGANKVYAASVAIAD